MSMTARERHVFVRKAARTIHKRSKGLLDIPLTPRTAPIVLRVVKAIALEAVRIRRVMQPIVDTPDRHIDPAAPHMAATLQSLADTLPDVLDPYKYVLVTFPVGEDVEVNYVTNAHLDDAVEVLRVMVAEFDAGQEAGD